MASKYRPTIQSTTTLVLLATWSILLFAWASHSRSFVKQPYYQQKMEAAKLMQRAMQVIKTQRMEKGVFIDNVNDPNQTALIGQKYSLITTDRGSLDEKLTATNPNFAAVMVEMLHEAGLHDGDPVAVAMTGGVPGANLALMSAMQVMQLQPYIITSLGSAMWGANDPNFTWLDMEHSLVDAGIFTHRSFAASLGGGSDKGRRLSPRGRELLTEAIQRNNVRLIQSEDLSQSIQTRIALYDSMADGHRIQTYINIGGGAGSLGHSINGRLIGTGVRKQLTMRNYQNAGAIIHYGQKGIPIINIEDINEIATRYGLPVAPVPLPKVGTGDVFVKERYNLAVTWIALLGVIGALVYVGWISQRQVRLADQGVEPEELL